MQLINDFFNWLNGIVWGFDDRQSYRTQGDIHPYFKDYNDVRLAVIP